MAREVRLVIAKGHDCITHFLGSKQRYKEYFNSNPGTYWYTPGWIENHLPPSKDRYEANYNSYLEKYGEDNAQYLMEMEQSWFKEYKTAVYIDLGVEVIQQNMRNIHRIAQNTLSGNMTGWAAMQP